MANSCHVLLLICSVLSLLCSCSIAKATSFRPKALILPVTKDTATTQYVTHLKQRTPFVPLKLTLDLGGQFLWVGCENGFVSSTYKPVPCGSAPCALTGASKGCGTCYYFTSPGCNNNTCINYYDNTVDQPYRFPYGNTGEVSQDVVAIQSTDGKEVTVPKFIFICADKFYLNRLASGVSGMAGLGRNKASLPFQFASAFSFPRKFAICLGDSNGVVFFGDGPYVFLPGLEFSKSLTYTPLIKNPVTTSSNIYASKSEPSSDYFIGVKGIRINGKAIKVNTTLLSIDHKGFGGTKISTVNPYTVLETSIYLAVVEAFTESLAQVPRVEGQWPLGACFNSTYLSSTRVGPGVPPLELVLQNDVVWRFLGANIMKQMGSEILCLGFIDGGVFPRTSIVIGGHQIEDNLLQFDLAASKVGFSGSLLGKRTNCGNFKFTSTA